MSNGILDGLTSMDDTLRAINQNIKTLNQQNQEVKELLQTLAGRDFGGSDGGNQYQTIDDIGANPAASLSMRGGWKYEFIDRTETEKQGGESTTVTTTGKPGFMLAFILVVQGADAEKTSIDFKSDDFTIDAVIEDRYKAGVFGSGANFIPYVPVYNTTNDVYAIAMGNSNGYHWRDEFRLQINYPSEAGTILESLSMFRVVIDDMSRFTEVTG